MKKYINMISPNGERETVDEFTQDETYKERVKLVNEYNLSDSYNNYYLSQRCCNDWK